MTEEDDRTGRPTLAGWLLGAGLAALALAFPQERLIGQFDSVTGAFHLALRAGIEQITSLRAEQAGFVLSAICYGACLPVTLSIARRLEFPFAVSLLASLVVLLSPVAWVAGTSPGPAALGLLLGLLLLGFLWQRERPVLGLVLGSWCLAVSCAPVSIWLLPALAWAVTPGGKGDPRRWRATAIVVGVGLAWLAALLLTESDSGTPGLLTKAIFGGSGGWGQILAFGAGLLPGLGLAALAAASLFLLRRHESEAPPPRWLLLWCVLPLVVATLGGSPTWQIPYLWILPPALIGALDLLARADERRLVPVALGTVAAQLAILLGALLILSSTDPLAPWRENAREALEPGDLVFTTRGDHAYLLRERWGLEVQRVDSNTDSEQRLEFARKATSEGRRVVFDTDVLDGRWSTFEPLVLELEAEVSLIRLESEPQSAR
jgi:hypothetical protein